VQSKIKIAVIGGTGKSGKYLVNQLMNLHFHFKILLRNPEKFQIKNSLIEIIKGDARNYDDILLLLAGCDAVISTLGQPQGEPPIFSEAAANIIRAMNECNIQRYILVTRLSIDLPFDNKSSHTKMKSEWMKTNFPQIVADKQNEYNILVKSNADWTLVRLPFIEQTDNNCEIKISLEDCPGDNINATSLANFLIEQLHDIKYLKKTPFIANA
jgi:putative NADH-flavin reductase